ncbi:MAG: FAD:protein FMN transferase [Planctomycetes bacterium]|nr:FAD:protein FMN transferase [Planctomycetota bacterium]
MQVRGLAMGTTYSIKYVERGDAASATVSGAIQKSLDDVDRLFSRYRPDSVVSEFNASQGTVEVGREFCRVLKDALQVAAATDGAFDPTVLPLFLLYPFGDVVDRSRMPDDEAIRRALESVGFGKLEVGDTTVRKRVPGVMVDPNAFAKGYGVDRVASALRESGHADFMVEIGGEVRCAGRKPDGSPWRIGIEGPGPDGGVAAVETVELVDCAIATSGDYRNFVEADGQRVHHVLDPRTGRNRARRVITATVRAEDCAFADAVATALMITGPDGIGLVRAAFPQRHIAVLMFVIGPDGAAERVESGWQG